MKFTRIIAILFIALSAWSCKNEDEEITYKSFDGILTFDLPPYVLPGDTLTLIPSGISRDDGGSWGLYWKISPVMSETDTVRRETDSPSISGEYVFTVPDTLCTINITLGAFADGYSNKTSVGKTVVISYDREKGSIRGNTLEEGDFIFTDPRDGTEYYCTTIGGKDWFKENLAYAGLGVPYSSSELMSTIYGRFYTWEEAQNACPEGWRVSSKKDWKDAAESVSGGRSFGEDDTFTGVGGAFRGDITFNGASLWDFWPNVKITNATGFSAIPVGYATYNEDDGYAFTGYKEYSVFWTMDEAAEDLGLYRYMYVDKPDILLGAAEKSSFAASVRCVRDTIADP